MFSLVDPRFSVHYYVRKGSWAFFDYPQINEVGKSDSHGRVRDER